MNLVPSRWRLLVAFLCACSAVKPRVLSYIDMHPRTQALPPPFAAGLTQAEVASDLDLLLHVLERGYGGRDFVPPQTYAEMVTQLRGLRGRAQTIDVLCTQLGDALWLLPDNHLQAKEVLAGDKGLRKCGTLFRASRREASVGINLATGQANTSCHTEVRATEQLGVFASLHLPPSDSPEWAPLDTQLGALFAQPSLVIDLRSNAGGDDARLYQLAKRLMDVSEVHGHMVRSVKRQTPETFTLWMNSVDRQGRRADGTLEPFLQPWYDEALKKRSLALAGKLPEYESEAVPHPHFNEGPKAYAGHVAILIDEQCGSSCESGLEVLEQFSRARVFGRRTGGYIHFGDVGWLRLPNSGIGVQISTKYNEYPNGVNYDKIGFLPDVEVPSGVDAYVPAVAWLKSQAH